MAVPGLDELAAALARNVYAGPRESADAGPVGGLYARCGRQACGHRRCGATARRRSVPRSGEWRSAANGCARCRDARPKNAQESKRRQSTPKRTLRAHLQTCPTAGRHGACRSPSTTFRKPDAISTWWPMKTRAAAVADAHRAARPAAPGGELRRQPPWPRRAARDRPGLGNGRADLRGDARADRERGRRGGRSCVCTGRAAGRNPTKASHTARLPPRTGRNRWLAAWSILARSRPSS